MAFVGAVTFGMGVAGVVVPAIRDSPVLKEVPFWVWPAAAVGGGIMLVTGTAVVGGTTAGVIAIRRSDRGRKRIADRRERVVERRPALQRVLSRPAIKKVAPNNQTTVPPSANTPQANRRPQKRDDRRGLLFRKGTVAGKSAERAGVDVSRMTARERVETVSTKDSREQARKDRARRRKKETDEAQRERAVRRSRRQDREQTRRDRF